MLLFMVTRSSRMCCQQPAGAHAASSSRAWHAPCCLLALPCRAEHLPFPRCLTHTGAAAASHKGHSRVRHFGAIFAFRGCLARLRRTATPQTRLRTRLGRDLKKVNRHFGSLNPKNLLASRRGASRPARPGDHGGDRPSALQCGPTNTAAEHRQARWRSCR